MPSPIKITRSQTKIDSMLLWNGPSAMKLSFFGVESFLLLRFERLRFNFSSCMRNFDTFWYNSSVQSPLDAMASVKIVLFGWTTKSIIVKGCHSSVETLSHLKSIKSHGRNERDWFTRNVNKIALGVGSSIEIILTRAKNRLKCREIASAKNIIRVIVGHIQYCEKMRKFNEFHYISFTLSSPHSQNTDIIPTRCECRIFTMFNNGNVTDIMSCVVIKLLVNVTDGWRFFQIILKLYYVAKMRNMRVLRVIFYSIFLCLHAIQNTNLTGW